MILKPNKEDTGLRGTSEGKLYVDKKVFFQRPKVKAILKSLSKLFSNNQNKVKEEKSDHIQKNPIFGSEIKSYVGINNHLIEQEINQRVDFKMSELNTSLTNIAERIKQGTLINPTQTREAFTSKLQLSNAITLLQERFNKERYMGTNRDGLLYQEIIKDKNKLVDSITKEILIKTDREFPRKASKINNLIEKHIYKNNI